MYVTDGSSERIKEAWLDPTWARGLLRIRLTPNSGYEAKVEADLLSANLLHGDDVESCTPHG